MEEKFNFHDILNTLLVEKGERKEEGRGKVVEKEERGRKKQCGIKKGKGGAREENKPGWMRRRKSVRLSIEEAKRERKRRERNKKPREMHYAFTIVSSSSGSRQPRKRRRH